MKFELKKTYDQQKAREYLNKLIESESKAEVKKMHSKRSTSQNSYLHVLFTLWGNETGYTIEEAKHTVKHALGYIYKVKLSEPNYTTGLPNPFDMGFVRKTSEMDSKELTIFIEKFRDWSAITCGFYLPSPEEFLEEQIYFENLIER